MQIIKTEIDGKLVIGIVFENKFEEEAVLTLCQKASSESINVFIRNEDLAEVANEDFLVNIMKVMEDYE